MTATLMLLSPVMRVFRAGTLRLPAVFALSLAALVSYTSSALAYRWTHTGIDSAGGNVGQFVSVAVGRDGRYHVSYHRNAIDAGGKNLKYCTNPNPTGGGAWTTQFVDAAGSMGSYSSIALAKRGPHISYYESEFANLRHAYYDSTLAAWVKETVDEAGIVGQYTAIAADTSTNTLRIAYFDATRPGLKLATKVGNALWSFDYVDTDGTVGLYNSITQSGDQIAYFDFTRRDLKYARFTGSSWITSTVDSVGDVGRYTSIASARGVTYITYYDNTTKDLKLAERIEGIWHITTVDSPGDIGQSTSLRITVDGHPAISYYDVANQNLKFAERFNGIWVINTVAFGGNVGRFNALVVDKSTSLPHILYYDDTNGVLRFARGRGEVTAVDEPPPLEPPVFPVMLRSRSNPVRFPAALELVAGSPTTVSVMIFDVYGRRIRNVFDGALPAGPRLFEWDGRDEMGRSVGSGIYFVSAASPAGRTTARLMVVH